MLLGESPRDARGAVMEPYPAVVQPRVETIGAGDGETGKEVADIRGVRLGKQATVESILERRRIALDSRGIDSDRLGTTSQEDVSAE